ncbi:hypothetical protein GOP47_0009476 [Adiantum capillus-veneris]|uniref:Uncharacterized protein n=1 Tax=Adiantum capillus-veneris TaxID=13818 RepID=A0A9D4ZJP5_ADICA|nr:hypothetical protein GOP47_0009476 [Adiantum capillus-veneris]
MQMYDSLRVTLSVSILRPGSDDPVALGSAQADTQTNGSLAPGRWRFRQHGSSASLACQRTASIFFRPHLANLAEQLHKQETGAEKAIEGDVIFEAARSHGPISTFGKPKER